MYQTIKGKQANTSIVIFLAFLLSIVGMILYSVSDGETVGITILIFVILILYYIIFLWIKKDTKYASFLCDCRFYVVSAILMYTVLPPVYCLLTLGKYGGAKVYRTVYSSNELLQTVIMSVLFFAGIAFGFYVRLHSKKTKSNDIQGLEETGDCKKMFLFWSIICIVTTTLFLLPFIHGGFKVIRDGGTILDVDIPNSPSIVGKIQGVFFSVEIMVVSTISMVYYGFQINTRQWVRRLILVAVLVFQIGIAVTTTRRARAVSILLCAFVMYIYRYQKKKNKIPVMQIVVAVIAVLFLYFLEVFMGLRRFDNTYAGFLQLFDGITAYDSLLLATRETPSLAMLSNIIYGLFRPIPILGKYIVQLFGIPNDAAPLYHWMASRYTTYQSGGGLAYTPQLEAYLSGGYFGCAIFGFVYGYMFSKKWGGLVNLLVIATAFSIARGNLQIVLGLLWPYRIIGYYFYDQLLFRKIKIQRC